MVEKLLEGSKRYYMWLLFLVALIAACFCVYLYQLFNGLGVTGMSRDVSWGLYISPTSSVWPLPPLCWFCPPISITTRNSRS